MLIQCPGCGNRISDKAHACPKCGYIPQKNNAAHAPKSSSRRTGIIISVCSGTILFLALIAIFGMRLWGEKRDQGIAEEIERQLTENTYEVKSDSDYQGYIGFTFLKRNKMTLYLGERIYRMTYEVKPCRDGFYDKMTKTCSMYIVKASDEDIKVELIFYAPDRLSRRLSGHIDGVIKDSDGRVYSFILNPVH